MFTSLKIVNISLSFLAATNLSATLRRNIESFERSEPRLPPVGVPIDGVAFTASSLVILPSLPVPVTVAGPIFFSSNIFLAAGDGVPEAYVAAGAVGAAAAGAGAAFGASATGAAAGAGTELDGFAAAVSIKQTTAPTATASPSSAFYVI